MNVNLTWKDPQTRNDGSPLGAAEIARIDVFVAVTGATNFAKLGDVAAGVQAFTQTDLPPGSYDFKLVVVDNQPDPKSSPGAVITVEIPEPPKAAPADVTDIAFTID